VTTLRLSYRELAERIGLTPEGARMLARRRRWQIIKGNDGRALVLVAEADLVARPPGRPREQPPGQPGDMTGLDQEHRERLQALRETVEHRTEALLAMTARAASAEGEAKALRDALADLAARLDRAEQRLALPWWRRWLGLALVAALLPSCSPATRDQLADAMTAAAVDVAIQDIGTAAGFALRDALD
jgi:hypothetical protein